MLIWPRPATSNCRHSVVFAECCHDSRVHDGVTGASDTCGKPVYSHILDATLAAQRPEAIDQLITRSDHAGRLQQLPGQEALLLGNHPAIVARVDALVDAFGWG